jgi:hypothetical protein
MRCTAVIGIYQMTSAAKFVRFAAALRSETGHRLFIDNEPESAGNSGYGQGASCHE